MALVIPVAVVLVPLAGMSSAVLVWARVMSAALARVLSAAQVGARVRLVGLLLPRGRWVLVVQAWLAPGLSFRVLVAQALPAGVLLVALVGVRVRLVGLWVVGARGVPMVPPAQVWAPLGRALSVLVVLGWLVLRVAVG